MDGVEGKDIDWEGSHALHMTEFQAKDEMAERRSRKGQGTERGGRW